MKILAIDTSSEICGVCILEDDKLIDDNSLSNGMTHSENLMPLVSEILERNNLKISDIDLISCVVGPGSFTGIRIGVSTIKALAEVENIKIAELTALEVLAGNIEDDNIRVSIIDARNDQVYCGIFDKDNNLIEEMIADSIDNTVQKLKKFSNITFVGNGAIKYKDLLNKEMSNITFCDNNLQNAYIVGKIGYKKYLENNLKTADELLPIYLRKSQAERMKK